MLNAQDIQILLQCLSVTQVQVKDAPRILEIQKKLEDMAKETETKITK